MCASRAAAGNEGMSSSEICVDIMLLPLGFLMLIGVVAGRVFKTCASAVTK